MPPRFKAISNFDVDEESMKTAVANETVIWSNQDENHDNGYLISKAWDRVAAATGFKKKSLMDKWKDMCKEEKDLLLKGPHLTSGSAGGHGGHASRMTVKLHYANPVGFLKDKNTPALKTFGNLDALMEERTISAPVEKPNNYSNLQYGFHNHRNYRSSVSCKSAANNQSSVRSRQVKFKN